MESTSEILRFNSRFSENLTNCYENLRLIRKLLKMVRDTYEKYGKVEVKR